MSPATLGCPPHQTPIECIEQPGGRIHQNHMDLERSLYCKRLNRDSQLQKKRHLLVEALTMCARRDLFLRTTILLETNLQSNNSNLLQSNSQNLSISLSHSAIQDSAVVLSELNAGAPWDFVPSFEKGSRSPWVARVGPWTPSRTLQGMDLSQDLEEEMLPLAVWPFKRPQNRQKHWHRLHISISLLVYRSRYLPHGYHFRQRLLLDL